MKIKDVAKLSTEERFLYWITERESIRGLKNRHEEKPWTTDEILQSYRFCNVRRMDDKVSKWLLDNWYEANYGHRNMLIACCLARHFNNPRSLEAIGFPRVWNPEKVKRILWEIKASGMNTFNAAYIVTGRHGEDKIESVVDYVVDVIYKHPPVLHTDSLESSCEALMGYDGIGSFLAGQIIADYRWGVGGKWADKRRWASIGPGSRRGMNRLRGRDVKYPLKQDHFLAELGQVIWDCKSRLPPSLTKRLEAIDYQNCLCEFDKYTRVLEGEGKPKQRYAGV